MQSSPIPSVLIDEIIQSVKLQTTYVESLLGLKTSIEWCIEMNDDEQIMALTLFLIPALSATLKMKGLYDNEGEEKHLYASPSNSVIINTMQIDDGLSLLIYVDDLRETMGRDAHHMLAKAAIDRVIAQYPIFNTELLHGYGSLYNM